jgi:hypothetical protein
MVCFCAADLLWATKIKSTADTLGISCRPVRNLDMLEARLVDSPVRALIVDLEAGETALALIRRLRAGALDEQAKSIRILAFGPHVAIDMLRSAKHAGADTVLARGAFASRLPDLLRQLAGDSGPIPDALEE